MTFDSLIRWIAAQGVVLESAHGGVPSAVEHIVGAPVRGNWWSHPKSKEIFRLTREVRDSADVLVCQLVDGRITFVHRRVWPALVRLAKRFPRSALARVEEVHSAEGKHVLRKTAFPKWVPAEVMREAEGMTDEQAEADLGAVISGQFG